MNGTVVLQPRSTFLVVLESGIAIIFMFLAIAGNLTVYLAIYRNKLLRTVPNFLLVNLATSDILNSAASFPLLIHVLVTGAWGFQEGVCQFQAFQTYLSYSCSLLTLAVTSVTRYYATVYPVKHRGIFKAKTLCVLISAVWVASFVFAGTPLVGWGRYQFEPSYALCIHDHNSSTSYNMFLFVFLIVNSTVIVTCYSKIFKAMKTRNRQVHSLFAQGSNSRQLEIINAQEVKLTNTIFIVICLFAICYAPTILLGFLLFTPLHIPRFARMLSTFSVGFASVVNPIVYWVRSKAFRQALKGLFRKNNTLRIDVSENASSSNTAERALVSTRKI